jgi:transposase
MCIRDRPLIDYQYAEWRSPVRLGMNYHVQIDEHYYSAPHSLRNEKLDARLTVTSVELFHKNKRVASHSRSYKRGYTTVAEHMPKAHREYAEWTPERLVKWASQTGESTAKLVDSILCGLVHPQQGFNSCLGIISLSKKYGSDRVEAASKRALAIGGVSYKSMKSILQNGLDSKPLPQQTSAKDPIVHPNLRSEGYYH